MGEQAAAGFKIGRARGSDEIERFCALMMIHTTMPDVDLPRVKRCVK